MYYPLSQVAADTAKFDTYSNNMWSVRHAAMSRLRQAAWKIIIRNRAEKKLSGLRDMVEQWGQRGFAIAENCASRVFNSYFTLYM